MLSYIAIARASCALRLVRLARLDDCCIWFEMQSKCQTCGVLVSSIKKSRLEVHRKSLGIASIVVYYNPRNYYRTLKPEDVG